MGLIHHFRSFIIYRIDTYIYIILYIYIQYIYIYTCGNTIELVVVFGFKRMQNRIFLLAQNQERENGGAETTTTTTTTNSDPQGCLVGYQCLCPICTCSY